MNPVQWFFLVGGAAFLLAALFFREMSFDGAGIVTVTFGIIGVSWMVPSLLMLIKGRSSD
jgi:uncharacterized membrane protein YhhN